MCSNNSIFFLPRSINIFKFPVFPPYVHILQGLICTCDLAVYSVHVTTGTITPSIVLPMLYPLPSTAAQGTISVSFRGDTVYNNKIKISVKFYFKCNARYFLLSFFKKILKDTYCTVHYVCIKKAIIYAIQQKIPSSC